jgi:predicted nuclease of predicted toxin-antitoxin system
MRFLVDRCAGRGLADWLSRAGYDSVYGGSLGPDPGDKALPRRAVSEGRILITIDTDFGHLVYKEGQAHCGTIRLPDVRKDVRIELIRIIIDRYKSRLEKGAIVTVRGDKVRISEP